MERNSIRLKAINSLEQGIKEELKIEEIIDSENLIEKGLSSLMIMKISNKLRKLGIKISFAKLMDQPTLKDWKDLIENAQISKKKKEKLMRNLGDKLKNIEFPLTDVQYAYWIGREDYQALGGVGCHAYLEIDGENVDVLRLKEAWNIIQRHHPMLRAKFTENGMQKIMDKPYSTEIEIYDLRYKSELEIEQKLIKLRKSISHRKLKVEEGKVAGLSVALLKNNKTRMFLDIDLLVADVLSLSILIRDLAEAYSGYKLNSPSEYTFENYIQEKEIDKEAMELDKTYWVNKIKSFPKEPPNLPIKKNPEFISNTIFNRKKKIIEKNVWNKVKENTAKYKMTPSIMLLTCYILVLERWCNQDKFLINMPLFNRDTENENLKNMIADFTNLLLIDYERKENETFLETMKRIYRIFLENVSHSSYSGVQVQRDIYKEIGSNNFIAPIVFACNIDYSLETSLSRKVFGEITYMISQTPQVWLDFQTYIIDDSLVLCWDAVEELFPDNLLNDMFGSLVEIIYLLSEQNDWNIIFDVLPKNQKQERDSELEKILPLKYSNKTLYSDFISNVKKYPNSTALIDGITGQQISYKDLYNKSLKIAYELVEKGVHKGDYVGITLPRGCRQIYSILGILFAGAVYVPIGINQPKDRQIKIYEQIGIKFIISDSNTIEELKLNEEDVSLIAVDNIDYAKKTLEKPIQIEAQDSCYIIMTSGSTGIPKGVEICHENAINTISDINSKYQINSSDTAIMVSAIDFDLSVYDIFGLLSVGGRIVLLDEENFKDPSLWIKLINKYEVTIWNTVPILFEMLVTMAEGENKDLPLRIVMLSGDWITVGLPQRFYKISEDSTVVAMGGATEASIWSNYFNVPKEPLNDLVTIPYGKPLENQVYRVIDDWGRICPNYVKGELLIGGVGVAKGYKGDKELTNKKFYIDGIRWYKTGDYGRTWNDGTIEFLGRKDGQIKIKGLRVELGEIEMAIKKLKFVLDSHVVAIYHGDSIDIAAYIVKHNDIQVEENEVKTLLRDFIPGYMIPRKYYITTERIALANSKLDKKKISHILNNKFLEENKINNYVFPNTNSEMKIEEIWKNTLEKDRISIKDNYFELGGDSLKAVSIVNKIKKYFNLINEISIGVIFKFPTIELLALETDRLTSEFDVEEV